MEDTLYTWHCWKLGEHTFVDIMKYQYNKMSTTVSINIHKSQYNNDIVNAVRKKHLKVLDDSIHFDQGLSKTFCAS